MKQGNPMKQRTFFQRTKDLATKVMDRLTKFAKVDEVEIQTEVKWRGLIRPSTMRIEHRKIAKSCTTGRPDGKPHQGYKECARRSSNKVYV